MAKAGGDVWSYRFDYEGAGRMGATHASDLAFTFGRVGNSGRQWANREEAQVLSQRMQDAFIAFARTRHPAIPEWPHHNSGDLPYMSFDATCAVKNDFVGSERRALWETVTPDVV